MIQYSQSIESARQTVSQVSQPVNQSLLLLFTTAASPLLATVYTNVNTIKCVQQQQVTRLENNNKFLQRRCFCFCFDKTKTLRNFFLLSFFHGLRGVYAFLCIKQLMSHVRAVQKSTDTDVMTYHYQCC